MKTNLEVDVLRRLRLKTQKKNNQKITSNFGRVLIPEKVWNLNFLKKISGDVGSGRLGVDGGGGGGLVRWEHASEHAYKQAMYLTIGLGTLLLAVSLKLPIF